MSKTPEIVATEILKISKLPCVIIGEAEKKLRFLKFTDKSVSVLTGMWHYSVTGTLKPIQLYLFAGFTLTSAHSVDGLLFPLYI